MLQLLNEYKNFFWLLAGFSIILFLLSLLLIPVLLIRIPEDYFIRYACHAPTTCKSSLQRVVLKIVLNIIGYFLLLSGIAMLLLPGQGILTILISLTLIDFPYKKRVEYFIISRPMVINNINKLREKNNVKPLRLKC